MKKQLSDWVKQHSAKDYKECYRVLNYPGYTDEEDYKLIFYISEMKHGAYSNSARCRINAIESNRNQIPFHNSTIYDAEVNINYDTGVAILTDNVVDEKSRGKGIGSLGMTYPHHLRCIHRYYQLLHQKNQNNQHQVMHPHLSLIHI